MRKSNRTMKMIWMKSPPSLISKSKAKNSWKTSFRSTRKWNNAGLWKATWICPSKGRSHQHSWRILRSWPLNCPKSAIPSFKDDSRLKSSSRNQKWHRSKWKWDRSPRLKKRSTLRFRMNCNLNLALHALLWSRTGFRKPTFGLRFKSSRWKLPWMRKDRTWMTVLMQGRSLPQDPKFLVLRDDFSFSN